MSSSQQENKTALLPGFGRPLNYVPLETDPDYVGDLFKNALSVKDLDIYACQRDSVVEGQLVQEWRMWPPDIR